MANPYITNYDISKIFVGNNKYDTGNYTNSTYDDVELAAGTLMGRIASTNKLVPHDSSASDGSQFPVGVLATDYTVLAGDNAVLTICVAGDVVEDKITLADGDTMATVISSKTIRDRIGSDTVGIKLVGSIEMTAYDNQ